MRQPLFMLGVLKPGVTKIDVYAVGNILLRKIKLNPRDFDTCKQDVFHWPFVLVVKRLDIAAGNRQNIAD